MARRRRMSDEEQQTVLDDDAALAAFVKLSADLKKGARELTTGQARYVVDAYYQVQQFRMEAANQVRAAKETGEPVAFLDWMATLTRRLEATIKGALDEYTDTLVYGRWAKSIVGVGPVIAAGLAAHLTPGIQSGRTTTAGSVWRFAGLDPTVTWQKGEKRPWNATLKTLCWKIGESFIKVQSREGDVYGKVYAERKLQERERNEQGVFQAQAERMLREKSYRRETKAKEAYEAGRLPDAHIHARARRYAVKIFLAHYFDVTYESIYDRKPPKPYIIEHGGHTHFIAPPNWPMR